MKSQQSEIPQWGAVFSEELVKAAPVSGILGVCSQFSPETERENTRNLSA